MQGGLASIKSSLLLDAEHHGLGWQENIDTHLHACMYNNPNSVT
jgi:hypothetical protein